MSGRFEVMLLGAVVAVLAGACGEECGRFACPAVACVAPFDLAVTDATTHMPLRDATATGDATCGTIPSGVVCAAGGSGGVFTVTVSAPGHAPAQVSVTVQPAAPAAACSCPACATWQPTSVELSPL